MQPQLARGYQIELVNNVVVDSLVQFNYLINDDLNSINNCFFIYLSKVFIYPGAS